MKVLRLLVTGGRDYSDVKTVDRVLRSYLARVDGVKTKLLVIHGGAPGLDTLAGDWCNKNAVPCVSMNAPWTGLGRAAGPVRNAWMLKYNKPKHCHVFPGGAGTASMKRLAKDAGLRVKETK